MELRNPHSKGEPKPKPPKWSATLWYLPVMLLLLWFWQSAISQFTYRTIPYPYSDFKAYLARHEVAKCVVRDEDIQGEIVQKQTTTAGTNSLSTTNLAVKTNPGPTTNSAAAKAGPVETKPMLFRTIRVEGAENDLEHATALARQMVCIFGMSETVGLARCAQRQNGALLLGTDGTFQRDCSEKTAEEIDEEVKAILDQTYAQAKAILTEHRDQLELVTRKLLESETIDAQTFNRLIGRPPAPEPDRRSAALPQIPPNGHA